MSDKTPKPAEQKPTPDVENTAAEENPAEKTTDKTQPKEIGGRKGPEPTRYGDWEKNGIISDF